MRVTGGSRRRKSAQADRHVRVLTAVVIDAVRDQSIEHAPLVIFVLLAACSCCSCCEPRRRMPLILAIEPDRRQAAQLSVVVRKRVHAELILVDTTERALDAIGNRMPDLVLVPALLSPQDDVALAAALRVIAAAAYVQMLTIPVLGSRTADLARRAACCRRSGAEKRAPPSPTDAIRPCSRNKSRRTSKPRRRSVRRTLP